jgi:hypothetical protein
MTREQFKPGNTAEHNKQIPAFYALFERAKVGTYRLGLLPVSGDLNHLVYLEGYPSFAEMEAADKKMEDVMSGSPALQAEMDALVIASTSRSLAEADEAIKGMDARDKKMEEALGGDIVVKQRQRTLADILAQATTTLYRVNRALSRPRPEFVAADPDFWKAKEPAKKEPAKK